MSLDRRSFVAAAVSLTAGAVARPSTAIELPAPLGGPDDPLGVRADFPITRQRTFLNSAYIAPIPRQVVDAGHAFLQEKANNSFQLGPLLRKCDEVRAQFARLINAASPNEIGLLYSTGEGRERRRFGVGSQGGR